MRMLVFPWCMLNDVVIHSLGGAGTEDRGRQGAGSAREVLCMHMTHGTCCLTCADIGKQCGSRGGDERAALCAQAG